MDGYMVLCIYILYGLVDGRSAKAAGSYPQYLFNFGISNIPAPEKRFKGGEDAYYANRNLLCVADGVSYWGFFGIDPAPFAQTLAKNVRDFFKDSRQLYIQEPKSLLIKTALKAKLIGSSTLVIAILDPQSGLLRTSYIGDSSYLILRPNKKTAAYDKIYRSKEQQHSFNFPFQVGTCGDHPNQAASFHHQLYSDDLVIVGSDGLFDNVSDAMISKTVSKNESKDLKKIASSLARMAYRLSLNPTYNSPFSIEARKANVEFTGGKTDDITVIVGKILLKSGRSKPAISS